MEITEQSTGLCCTAVYNTDLFEEANIGRMLDHYKTGLSGIAVNQNQFIEALSRSKESERQQISV